MKKKILEIARQELQEKKLTRKEAIKKTGYIALSAATMMMLLPTQGHAGSPTVQPPKPTNTAPNTHQGIWDD